MGATGIPLADLLGGREGGLQIVLLDPATPPSGLISDLAPGLAAPSPAGNTIVMISARPIDAAAHQPDADPVFTDALVRRLLEPGASITTILNEVLTDVALNTQFRQVPQIVLPPSGIADFVPAADADPDLAANPATGIDPAPPIPDTQYQIIVRDPESGDGSGDFGGLFDPPEQQAIPLDSAGGGGGMA